MMRPFLVEKVFSKVDGDVFFGIRKFPVSCGQTHSVLVTNPEMCRQLVASGITNYSIVYLHAPDDVRMARLGNRASDGAAELERRAATEVAQFDGIMNLCVVGDIPKLVILFALPTAYFGAHYLFKGVTPYKASRIRIRASRPLWMHTDGEVLPQTSEFTAECCRDALKVIY